MELLLDPTVWASLATLTILEIVLGIDNVIFISVLVGRLPEHQQARARFVGLMGAMLMRIVLLMGIVWQSLDRAAVGKNFVLDNIIVFLSKWDILHRWLSYGEEPALDRFEKLAAGLLAGDLLNPKPDLAL